MTRAQPTQTSPSRTVQPAQQTLIDHLHELRARLFWIVLTLILATSVSYLVKDQIMAIVMQPLGGQRLVYLTPIGGFNFIFKVSLCVGLAAILPVIIYHLYRFLEPLMEQRRKRSVVFFMAGSFLLAVAGGCFAYFAGLPAALHFLTGFTIQNVSAMLTVESYLAFVVTYMLGFAALFQIPLVLMIINTIKPIPPKKLMSFQRFIILGAFIAAAIISPTPDITNQAILALPIIFMYQLGALLVWLQSRAVKRRGRNSQPATTQVAAPQSQPLLTQRPVTTAPAAMPASTPRTSQRPRPIMDIATHGHRTAPPPRVQQRQVHSDVIRRVPAARPQPRPMAPRVNSIDGIVRRQPLSQMG